MERIILFDGVCNLCDQSVQFIMKRDPKGYFKFASLQNDSGKELLKKYHVSAEVDSMVLVDSNHCYIKSTAALMICKNLKGVWKFLYFLIVIPRPVRDLLYGITAKNRYRWFGTKVSCMLPSEEDRKRLL